MANTPPFRRRLLIGTVSKDYGVLASEEFSRWLDGLRTSINTSGSSSETVNMATTLYLSRPTETASTAYISQGEVVTNTQYAQSSSTPSNTIY